MGGGSSTPTGEDPSEFENKSSPAATPSGGTPDTPSTESSDSTASSGPRSQLTDNDEAEIEAHSDSMTSVLSTKAPMGAPSPGEFANQAFADGVQARRVEAGENGHAAAPVDPNADVIGGWDAFDADDIVDSQPLNEAVDTSGRTSGQMQEVTLADRDDRAAKKAYVTDYAHDANYRDAPRRENAHSQMAVYSALDAMGVEAPRHAFDQESKQVYVESVQRPGYDAQVAEPDELSPEYANRVDPDQLKDTMAANLIAGNGDLKPDNLMVGEDGNVTAFDFDYTETQGTLAGVEATYGGWMQKSIDSINEVRDEDMDLEASDVVDRAEEVATQLDESGTVNRVVEAASQYDDVFANESDDDYGGWDSQLESIGDRIEKHVTNWSNESSENII